VTDVFGRTIRGLEVGLKVGDIATFDLQTCDVDDDAEEVLQRPELEPFSAVPAVESGRVVGVLERNGRGDGKVRNASRALDDSILVAFEEPLKSFLPLLVDSPYRLVLQGSRIEGIVTWSDVHKLPVRLLVFALVTHLELTMADAIVSAWPSDSWLDKMKTQRRAKVDEKIAQLRGDELDPPLIELTEFADKAQLVVRIGGFPLETTKRRALNELGKLERLRNKVAHAATLASDHAGYCDFVARLGLVEEWLARIQTHRDQLSPSRR
jgi:hypothetical protein